VPSFIDKSLKGDIEMKHVLSRIPFFLVVMFCVFFSLNGLAQSQQRNSAGTVSGSNWVGVNNAASINNACTYPNSGWGPISMTNWGFAIPSGAAITGIEVVVKGASTAGTNNITLIKGGSTVGNTVDAAISGGSCPGNAATVGGASDTWGTTWSPSDLNASNFGVLYDPQYQGRQFDGVQVIVHFLVVGDYTDLQVSKTDGVTSAVPGQNLTYTIVVTNSGPSDDPSVNLVDNFPAVLNATYTSAASGGAGGNTNPGSGHLNETLNMPAGSSVTYTVTCDIASHATGVLNNTATVTSSITDIDVADNSSTDDDTVLVPEADLAVTKDDGVVTAVPGGSVVYTIQVTNSGPSDDPSVTLTDVFPAILTPNYTSVAAGGASGNTAAGAGNLGETLSMPAGSSVSYTVTCSIDPGASGTLSNTATVTASVSDPTSSNNTATDDDTVLNASADLGVTKTDGVTTATPGETVTYTIVVTNAGPSDDPAVSLSDVFPANLTASFTSVAAGGASGNTAAGSGDLSETMSMPSGSSVTYTATCAIDSSATGTLSNTATVTASVSDPTSSNNTATDDDTVLNASADLGVTKTDGVTTATPGGNVIYTIVVTNAGPSDDPAVSLSDVFPANLTASFTSVAAGGASGNTAAGSGDLSETLSMPSGSSVTYTVTCVIDSSATGTLSNTATVTASVSDPTSGNNTATDDDTVLNASADLGVTKTDGVTTATPGETVTYTIVVTNAGPSDDPAVSLSDVFPANLTASFTSVAAGGASGNTAAGSGDLSETLSMPSGSSVTYTATCAIDSSATGTLSNTATVTASVSDPSSGNNTATDDDTALNASADLSVTKSDGVINAVPGDALTYTIEVSNAGPSDAPGTLVSDVFPTDLNDVTWSCSASAGSTCAGAGSGDIHETVDIAAGGTVTFTATGTVDSMFVGSLTNTVDVATDAAVTDPNTSNNNATDNTTIYSPADISATKELFGAPFILGNLVTYEIVITNASASAQFDNLGDEFVDDIPPELVLVSATASSGSVDLDYGLNQVRWNGAIPGNGQVVITISARISLHAVDETISNQATIQFDADGDGINESVVLTDDPNTGTLGDATVFVGLPIPVPTLSVYGLLGLVLIMMTTLIIRKRTSVS